MTSKAQKRIKRNRRHHRVRATVKGNEGRPRLSVFRSANHIYAQIINDASGKTLLQVSSLKKDKKKKQKKIETAKAIGSQIAKLALQKGIKKVAFDRGGYAYHGRVKALAAAAREAGLDF